MMRKFCAILAGAILLLTLFGGSVWASETDRIRTLADEILTEELTKRGADDLQSFVNGYLTENAGMDTEWWILSLAQLAHTQSGAEFDAGSYRNALSAYLETEPPIPAATKQRCALALIAIGAEDDPFVDRVVDETVGKGGIASYIFGLQLLCSGAPSAEYTADSIIDVLLSRRLADGGWALGGAVSDTDVTAMCVQALASYTDRADIRRAVEDAIVLLSNKQLPDGDYTAYGEPNPESGAQVILALTAAGIDPLSDERFHKNGSNLLDGILKYRLPDGGFSHTAGGQYNAIATVQTHMALTALLRQSSGQGGFYPIAPPEVPPSEVPPTAGGTTVTPGTSTAPTVETSSVQTSAGTDRPVGTDRPAATDSAADPGRGPGTGGLSYKAVGVSILLILTASACLILYLTGRRSPGNFILAVLIGGGLILLLCLTNIQSRSDYYKPEDPADNDGPSVLLSIRCDELIGIGDPALIPADGIILPETRFALSEGESVYDILIRAAKSNGITVEHSGAPGMAYIVGIAGLYEFDYGDLSGWTYTVNGVSPSMSCEAYTLSDGEVIEWRYTLTVGFEQNS